MARIVVAGAGAAGASVAYHLALRGARDVVLCDRGTVASGATGKAMGGVRQQFSTAAEVRLVQASVRFFERLGRPFFDQVGYVFVATSDTGWTELQQRAALQRSLGVPVETTDVPAGIRADDVRGAVACWSDGVADPAAVAREFVRLAVERGVELREETDAAAVEGDVLVVACGPWSAEVAARRSVELPVRPLCRQLLETGALELPQDLPMVVEEETGFHFRRRGERLLLAMSDAAQRWGFDEVVDETVFEDRRSRLVHRYPQAASTRIERGWAGLYDVTPDAHPIVGWVGDGVYAVCGFSGHGFMQSPAVGDAASAELLGEEPEVDLSPYRLERFAHGDVPHETLIL